MMRAGIGNDIHRLIAGSKLILGGVDVPFDKGPDAHSDGDVAIHALIDALLGAAGLGDIGTHFPDSEPRYRGASSIDLLRRCIELLSEAGFRPHNVDISILIERPRLAPYLGLMVERIAAVLELPANRVNIKAGTNEGMDAIGRGEAVAALAVVTVIGGHTQFEDSST